jgi:carbamate kinase
MPRQPAAESKPIGPVYGEEEARGLAAEHGWTVAPDGRYFRRVVPSPEPREILELSSVEQLIAAGAVVVCAGGGGIPVVAERGRLRGVEAVIDKDLTAALLAESLDADRLLMLTDVPCVERDWGTEAATPIRSAHPSELRRLPFEAGSIGPKIDAACRFVEHTGREAAIGALGDLAAVARAEAGTQIAPVRLHAVA